LVSAIWFVGWQIVFAAIPFFQTDFELQEPRDNLILLLMGLQFLSLACAALSALLLIFRFIDFRKVKK
jgi:hypothetical protein